jgi:hypothetical protein
MTIFMNHCGQIRINDLAWRGGKDRGMSPDRDPRLSAQILRASDPLKGLKYQ